MNYSQKLESGMVYSLLDYTSPKVFNGLYFECLTTDQKIPANAKNKNDDLSFDEVRYVENI